MSRYRVERLLGAGGMATVRLAFDDELGRPVALKVLHSGLAGDGTFRKRFLREARLAARVSHPNVVHVFDVGSNEHGDPCIVMEYVEGESLAQLLAREGRLPVDRAVPLVAQAAAGLAHAHAAGLVHRDVKPHNLLVRSDGTVKVADFGIARAAQEARLTETGTVLGTAAYLSPEQAAAEEVTSAADVYALGACLYEALTGRTPHEFGSLVELVAKQRQAPIRPLRELAPDVPPAIEDVVMRCLARNPEYRPAAPEVAAALGAPAEDAATEPLSRLRRGRLPLWAALAGAAALAALGLGLAATFAERSQRSPAEPAPPVQPVPRGATPAAQARSIAAWLRRYSR